MRSAGIRMAAPCRTLPEDEVRVAALALGGPRDWPVYFRHHARTFRLASRLFPPHEAGIVSALYTYCRFTDDLVDEPWDDASPSSLSARLSAWRALSLAAFDGERTAIPLLDEALRTAGEAGVHRAYVEALLEGVAMDLSSSRYQTWADLERYTFGVAGAVGGWMAQLFGIESPDMLGRAHALGHGMQLTNIARDVGEDWKRGRLYLPDELLAAHGVSADDIGEMSAGRRPVSNDFREAIRSLIARADRYYETAWPGIAGLPPFFRRPVAAAAASYRGIHREIRRGDFDTITHRAHTSFARKLYLGGRGVIRAARLS